MGNSYRRLLLAADDRADVTIVNVALPAIEQDLGFSQPDLTRVVNGFLVTFGSLLLLAAGSATCSSKARSSPASSSSRSPRSSAASPHAGRADRRRLLQGVGAAAEASVILAIIVTEFPEAADRAPAMSA